MPASRPLPRPRRWTIPLLLILLVAAGVRYESVRVLAADGSLLEEFKHFTFLTWKEPPVTHPRAKTIERARFAVFGLWWSKVMGSPVTSPSPAP